MKLKKMDGERVSAAFGRYARYGFDRRDLHDFDMIDCIRGSVKDEREAREMLAVYDTLRLLKYMKKREELRAVQAVYFQRRGRRLRRREVSLRVRCFAAENYYDDRTVYRRLEAVKRLYLAVLAGL